MMLSILENFPEMASIPNYVKSFRNKVRLQKTLLTTSCTDALEMCAMLIDIKSGDEVIVPSYTFVSSALAFVRQGAKIVFADSRANHPNIDVEAIKNKITAKTKSYSLCSLFWYFSGHGRNTSFG